MNHRAVNGNYSSKTGVICLKKIRLLGEQLKKGASIRQSVGIKMERLYFFFFFVFLLLGMYEPLLASECRQSPNSGTFEDIAQIQELAPDLEEASVANPKERRTTKIVIGMPELGQSSGSSQKGVTRESACEMPLNAVIDVGAGLV